ncbi:MAG: hypothetical protein ACHQFX_09040 [Chitinophagales bacterium]
MNRITLSTILAASLLCSFFMPFFYWNSFEMNGFNFLLSDHIPSYKYLLLLTPLVVLFYLFGALSEESTSFSRKLLSWVPLTTLLVVFILIFINVGFDRLVFPNGNIFSNTGVGFWLALISSFLLALVKRRDKKLLPLLKNE